MRILHIINSLDEAGGGPVEALRSFGEAAGGDVLQEVLTLDPLGAVSTGGFPMNVHALGRLPAPGNGPLAKLRNWMNPAPEALEWGREHIGGYDAVVVHGLWNASTRLAGLLLSNSGVPYGVYPHGMLDPWFRRRYPGKHLAKQVLWLINEGRLLNDAGAVLFTCEQERLLARGSFLPYSVRERVVAFGTDAPLLFDPNQEAAFRALLPTLGQRPYLLFLSRIHEKKGCDLLIQAFASIAVEHPDLDLVIAGPDQAGLTPSLKAMAAAAGVANRIHWPGMVTGPAKYGAYHGAEAFTLTSHQENFGIVVAEALACSCPVLISDKVNIWHEVEQAGAGLIEPDTKAGAEKLLKRFLALGPKERDALRNAGPKLFSQKFTSRAAFDDLVAILAELAAPD